MDHSLLMALRNEIRNLRTWGFSLLTWGGALPGLAARRLGIRHDPAGPVLDARSALSDWSSDILRG